MAYCVGELFAGAGGMALGAQRAGFSHAWATDKADDACATFRHNLPGCQVLCADISKVDLHQLPPIDCLAFGFPCNDFSNVGKQTGIAGAYGGLYQYGVQALQTLAPSSFVAENVSGIASSGLDVILAALRGAGYNIFLHKYRFEWYDVPQARHRIIIVGFHASTGIAQYTHPAPTSRHNPPTAAAALAAIPDSATNNDMPAHAPAVVARLQHIKPGENAFTANLPPHLQLDMKSNAKISQIYRRLIPNKPAYTVTASGGGGTHLYHWQEDRALTNRERARLQTFPDDYHFIGGVGSVRKQIGMAVPPVGAQAVFAGVMRKLVASRIQPCRC